MRALQLTDPGVLELRDVPVPGIGPDEVLIEVAVAGLGHSDVHLRRRESPASAFSLTDGTKSDRRKVIALARHGKIDIEVVPYALDKGVQAFDDLEAGVVRPSFSCCEIHGPSRPARGASERS